ncbi:MBL fold metallo-hydrolase [Halosegnis longus]|uniref:MBL fold metallo-hydrolase n=1 Tax=Halosegnis longus TaxID=2216012 RepID=UPI00129EA6E3|nr:MBL fold metallo-hydrolase [Halosegnis longus]
MHDQQTQSVHRVEFPVDWPPGHVACHLLGGAEPVLVDAGIPTAPEQETPADERLESTLARAGYDLADVEHLVLTHPHVDHIGQVQTVLDAGDPTVYAPGSVRERFAQDATELGDRVRENAAAAGITGDALDDEVESAVESLERNRRLLAPEAVDEWLTPGEASFGPVSGTAIHTPGHQADHLAYLLEHDDQTLLFSGDTVMEPFRAVVIHDGMDDGYTEAFEAAFTALDRLEPHDPDRVFSGHGKPHEQFGEILDRDRRRLHKRLDAIEDLVDDGFETMPEVAAELARGRKPRYMYAETMSGLAHLEQTDRVETELVDGVRRYA